MTTKSINWPFEGINIFVKWVKKKFLVSHSLVSFFKFQIPKKEARSSGASFPIYGYKRPRIPSTSVGIFCATHNIFRSLILSCCIMENKNVLPHDSGHLEFKMYSSLNSVYLWIRSCTLKRTPRRPFSIGNFGEIVKI